MQALLKGAWKTTEITSLTPWTERVCALTWIFLWLKLVQLEHYPFPVLLGAVLFLPDHVEITTFALRMTNY